MTENPILEAANKLRETTKNLVNEDLVGIFPKNYVYEMGDKNCVYLVMRGYGEHGGGFFRDGDLVILDRDGQYKTGRVHQKVKAYTSGWEIRDARLELAPDLTVVKYSPRLILELFGQLEKEYVEFTEPDRIDKATQALNKRAEVATEIIATSREALIEMGEDNPDLSFGEKDYGATIIPMLNEILSELQPSCTPTFKQREVAFTYFKRKDELKAEIAALCSNMRVRPVESWFKDLTEKTVSDGIFPVTYKDKDGLEWFYPEDPLDASFRVRSGHTNYGRAGKDAEIWAWGISKNGDVREIKEFSKNKDGSLVTQRCVEHLLQEAPTIVGSLVSKTVSQYFPKLKVGIF